MWQQYGHVAKAAIFHIDEKGFKLQGTIEHIDAFEGGTEELYPIDPLELEEEVIGVEEDRGIFGALIKSSIFAPEEEVADIIAVPDEKLPYIVNDPWKYNVRRILFIEDNLYTVSSALLKINTLTDLSPIKEVPLEKEKPSDFEVIN